MEDAERCLIATPSTSTTTAAGMDFKNRYRQAKQKISKWWRRVSRSPPVDGHTPTRRRPDPKPLQYNRRMTTLFGRLFPSIIPIFKTTIIILLALLSPLTAALKSGSFHNPYMPNLRPAFVVNFEMSTVICQHSAESMDLHMHEISILCDGKVDCYASAALHDEMFPYCDYNSSCNATACRNHGACFVENGDTPECACNAGYGGDRCEVETRGDRAHCEQNGRPCHWLATCNAVERTCECPLGFQGDGHLCTDIDECSIGVKCPEHSQCINLPGTYMCNCTEGYIPRAGPDGADESCIGQESLFNNNGSVAAVRRSAPSQDIPEVESLTDSNAAVVQKRIETNAASAASAVAHKKRGKVGGGNVVVEQSTFNEVGEEGGKNRTEGRKLKIERTSEVVHEVREQRILTGGYVLLRKNSSTSPDDTLGIQLNGLLEAVNLTRLTNVDLAMAGPDAQDPLRLEFEPMECKLGSVSAAGQLTCPSYSECQGGFCHCVEGYGWDPVQRKCEVIPGLRWLRTHGGGRVDDLGGGRNGVDETSMGYEGGGTNHENGDRSSTAEFPEDGNPHVGEIGLEISSSYGIPTPTKFEKFGGEPTTTQPEGNKGTEQTMPPPTIPAGLPKEEEEGVLSTKGDGSTTRLPIIASSTKPTYTQPSDSTYKSDSTPRTEIGESELPPESVDRDRKEKVSSTTSTPDVETTGRPLTTLTTTSTPRTTEGGETIEGESPRHPITRPRGQTVGSKETGNNGAGVVTPAVESIPTTQLETITSLTTGAKGKSSITATVASTERPSTSAASATVSVSRSSALPLPLALSSVATKRSTQTLLPTTTEAMSTMHGSTASAQFPEMRRRPTERTPLMTSVPESPTTPAAITESEGPSSTHGSGLEIRGGWVVTTPTAMSPLLSSTQPFTLKETASSKGTTRAPPKELITIASRGSGELQPQASTSSTGPLITRPKIPKESAASTTVSIFPAEGVSGNTRSTTTAPTTPSPARESSSLSTPSSMIPSAGLEIAGKEVFTASTTSTSAPIPALEVETTTIPSAKRSSTIRPSATTTKAAETPSGSGIITQSSKSGSVSTAATVAGNSGSTSQNPTSTAIPTRSTAPTTIPEAGLEIAGKGIVTASGTSIDSRTRTTLSPSPTRRAEITTVSSASRSSTIRPSATTKKASHTPSSIGTTIIGSTTQSSKPNIASPAETGTGNTGSTAQSSTSTAAPSTSATSKTPTLTTTAAALTGESSTLFSPPTTIPEAGLEIAGEEIVTASTTPARSEIQTSSSGSPTPKAETTSASSSTPTATATTQSISSSKTFETPSSTGNPVEGRQTLEAGSVSPTAIVTGNTEPVTVTSTRSSTVSGPVTLSTPDNPARKDIAAASTTLISLAQTNSLPTPTPRVESITVHSTTASPTVPERAASAKPLTTSTGKSTATKTEMTGSTASLQTEVPSPRRSSTASIPHPSPETAEPPPSSMRKASSTPSSRSYSTPIPTEAPAAATSTSSTRNSESRTPISNTVSSQSISPPPSPSLARGQFTLSPPATATPPETGLEILGREIVTASVGSTVSNVHASSLPVPTPRAETTTITSASGSSTTSVPDPSPTTTQPAPFTKAASTTLSSIGGTTRSLNGNLSSTTLLLSTKSQPPTTLTKLGLPTPSSRIYTTASISQPSPATAEPPSSIRKAASTPSSLTSSTFKAPDSTTSIPVSAKGDEGSPEAGLEISGIGIEIEGPSTSNRRQSTTASTINVPSTTAEPTTVSTIPKPSSPKSTTGLRPGEATRSSGKPEGIASTSTARPSVSTASKEGSSPAITFSTSKEATSMSPSTSIPIEALAPATTTRKAPETPSMSPSTSIPPEAPAAAITTREAPEAQTPEAGLEISGIGIATEGSSTSTRQALSTTTLSGIGSSLPAMAKSTAASTGPNGSAMSKSTTVASSSMAFPASTRAASSFIAGASTGASTPSSRTAGIKITTSTPEEEVSSTPPEQGLIIGPDELWGTRKLASTASSTSIPRTPAPGVGTTESATTTANSPRPAVGTAISTTTLPTSISTTLAPAELTATPTTGGSEQKLLIGPDELAGTPSTASTPLSPTNPVIIESRTNATDTKWQTHYTTTQSGKGNGAVTTATSPATHPGKEYPEITVDSGENPDKMTTDEAVVKVKGVATSSTTTTSVIITMPTKAIKKTTTKDVFTLQPLTTTEATNAWKPPEITIDSGENPDERTTDESIGKGKGTGGSTPLTTAGITTPIHGKLTQKTTTKDVFTLSPLTITEAPITNNPTEITTDSVEDPDERKQTGKTVSSTPPIHPSPTAEERTTTSVTITSRLRPNRCISSDECGKDAYCERASGVCRCNAGFWGSPPQTPCIDIDECLARAHDCHPSSECVNYAGGFDCHCPAGHRMNTSGVCEDIDECQEQNGTLCDSTSGRCINLPGLYKCQCLTGYSGDGYDCYPVGKKPCSLKQWTLSDCGKTHVCLVDGRGEVDCNLCKRGFRKKHGVCSDIDECSEPAESPDHHSCHPNAKCLNTVGGYRCQCKVGFEGSGFHCTDIDECSQNAHERGQSACHPQAACTNSIGSYRCTCPQGWGGDGWLECINPIDSRCSHLPERTRLGTCAGKSNNTACLSMERVLGGEVNGPTSLCECPANLRYNPTNQQCEDINECQEGRHNCDIRTSHCVNSAGGYHCVCLGGFEGTNGACTDIDECRRGVAGCRPNAHCINTVGAFMCQCPPNTIDNGRYCVAEERRRPSPEKARSCTEERAEICRSINKTCHIDDEETAQCGACLPGHQPMEGRCKAISEFGSCADSSTTCNENANCLDSGAGKHHCVCGKGFIGDGVRCDDIDECSMPGLCDINAECTNLHGSYSCECRYGYEGDGTHCENVTPLTEAPTQPTASERRSPATIAALMGGTTPSTAHQQSRITTAAPSTPLARITTIYPHPTAPPTTTTLSSNAFSSTPLTTVASTTTHGAVARPSGCSPAVESTCDRNAKCLPSIGRCHCLPGFVGDGRWCEPDKWDCVAEVDLCSEHADCVGRRCRCREGYTGDGTTCISMKTHPHPGVEQCQACHCRADCVNGKCKCWTGHFGNGVICVPDPNDCLIYPGLCYPVGKCNSVRRRCECASGKLVDSGMKCIGVGSGGVRMQAPQVDKSSCPSGCPANSECTNGACRCFGGYVMDEYERCIDIDECRMAEATCGANSHCQNLDGSYVCRCLDGYIGDGPKQCHPYRQMGNHGDHIECLPDGIRLHLPPDFHGRVSVRGQEDKQQCAKNFPDEHHHYFHIPIRGCELEVEANNTITTTVIVRTHPAFVTQSSYAYRLRCSLMPPSELLPKASLHFVRLRTPTDGSSASIPEVDVYRTGPPPPTCTLTVSNERERQVQHAELGQVLRLTLRIEPSQHFHIHPRNCYAINMGTGQKHPLTDATGCPVNSELFPAWRRVQSNVAEAPFQTFKWPNCYMVRFECDCSGCVGECPTTDCCETVVRRWRRFSGAGGIRLRHTGDRIGGRALVNNASSRVFSPMLALHVEGENDTQSLEQWLVEGTHFEKNDSRSPLSLLASCTLMALIIAFVLFLIVRVVRAKKEMRRRLCPSVGELFERRTNPSYINFT